MKLTILAEKLRAAFSVAQPAAKKKSYAPIFGYVLLDATNDGGLIATGTDAEHVRAWHTVSARVDEAGSVALPPEPLADFLEAASDGAAVEITVDDKHRAVLVSGATRARIAGLNPQDFPMAPDFSEPLCDVTIGAADLAGMISQVSHAVAKGDSRVALNGILLRATDGTLTVVGCDTYRLALASIAVDVPDFEALPIGGPFSTTAKHLARATSVRLTVDAKRSYLLMDSEAGCWAVRLLEGDYPDYNRIIPKNAPNAVTMLRADLKRAVNLAKRIEHTADGYMVRLSVGAERIGIQAGKDSDEQQVSTEIPATLDRGDPLTIVFNTRYLGDAIEALDAERITLEMTSPGHPGLLRDAESSAVLHILMPVKLKP